MSLNIKKSWVKALRSGKYSEVVDLETKLIDSIIGKYGFGIICQKYEAKTGIKLTSYMINDKLTFVKIANFIETDPNFFK